MPPEPPSPTTGEQTDAELEELLIHLRSKRRALVRQVWDVETEIIEIKERMRKRRKELWWSD